MKGGMRVAGVVVALGLLGSAAQADSTYSFNLTPGLGIGTGSTFGASGTFTLNGFGGITGGSASFGLGGASYTIGGGGGLLVANTLSLSFGTPGAVNLVLQGGPITSSSGGFSGTVQATAGAGGSSSSEFGSFTASLFSSGSSGGSGGGGGSGGAPAPEVNTLLGFALVGSTFAFLRRRRGGRTVRSAA